MCDTIYRQAAIEFVDYLLSQPCKGHTGDFVEGMRDGYYRIRSGIKYLPSAQPVNYGSTKSDSSSQLKLNNDLISRQDAIDAVKDLPNCRNGFSDTYDKACIIGVLEDLPTAQPERKKGKWITEVKHYKDESQEFYYEHTRCSNCGAKKRIGWHDANYCPNCGARMDGEIYE